MRPEDLGTSDDSELYLHSPGRFARETYFYPSFLGHYVCDSRYSVKRKNYDSFLLMYVRDGSGYVETENEQYYLFAGNVILIDCYAPHKYYTTTGWDICWIHFDGPVARNYYKAATQNGRVLFLEDSAQIVPPLMKLLELFENNQPKDDAEMSLLITEMLTEFILCSQKSDESTQQAKRIEDSIKYISNHLGEEITLEQLARQAMLSPCYYLRLFKSRTGFTPYQYLIMVRIDYSCFLLRTTTFSIKEISFRCGFHSESSFCTSFRKTLGLTPKQFRDQ